MKSNVYNTKAINCYFTESHFGLLLFLLYEMRTCTPGFLCQEESSCY